MLLRTIRNIKAEAAWRKRYMSFKANSCKNPSKTFLIFNSQFCTDIYIDENSIPPDWEITADISRIKSADIVVFHIPTMEFFTYWGLRTPTKQPGQIWVGWSMESHVQHPKQADPEFMSHFDLTVGYEKNSDVWCPYYFPELEKSKDLPVDEKTDLIAFLFSNPKEYSGRTCYAKELMKHLDAHSYGRVLHNRKMPNDFGDDAKISLLSRYRFNLAFENSISIDYVTEKFFHPLIAGCVPVYLGAPNIEEFEPGDNCFIDVRKFGSPKEMAEYLLELEHNENAYHEYHQWRSKPLKEGFLNMLQAHKKNWISQIIKIVESGEKIKIQSIANA